jgi:RNA polymerase sigma-70 factor (ECF subfamily)
MSHAQRTQERLIAKARNGDRSAQQELWRSHRRWVAAIVLAHRPHSVDVDDLMQDVALKMISKLDTLREPASFRPWLRQIVLNVCRGSARSLHPTLRLDSAPSDDNGHVRGVVGECVDHHDSSQHQVELHDASDRLMKQLISLPAEYREPLLLRCVQSMSYQQISELLNLPITTIETRLARARRMLREELGDSSD